MDNTENAGTQATGQTAEAKRNRRPKQITLLVDRQPELRVSAGGFSKCTLSGREVEPDGQVGRRYKYATIWRKAGETLHKMLGERELSRENPTRVTLQGNWEKREFKGKDGTTQQRWDFKAFLFSLDGKPIRQRETGQAGDDSAGGRSSSQAAAGAGQQGERKRREFVEQLVVVTPVEQREVKDGKVVSEFLVVRKKDWDNPEFDRDAEKNQIKLTMWDEAGRKAWADVESMGNFHGFYMDLSHPVVLEAKGSWSKRREDDERDAHLNPFSFTATEHKVIDAPNMPQQESRRDGAEPKAANREPEPAL